MANLPVLPYQFVPREMDIQHGSEGRLQRNMVIVDDPPLDHSQHALVMVVPPLEIYNMKKFLQRSEDFFEMIMVRLLLRVRSICSAWVLFVSMTVLLEIR